MNTFIKRSMKVALALVFIGASVVPACAHRGKGFKNLPKSLGKKSPFTGTAPTVRALRTPRISSTLAVSKVAHLTRAGNMALKLERVVVPQVVTPNPNAFLTPGKAFAVTPPRAFWDQDTIIEKIQKMDISSLVRKQMHQTSHVGWPYLPAWKEYSDIQINFGEWITFETPDFIPFRDVACKYTGRKDILQDTLVIFTLKKADEFFFIKQADGKLYIKKDALIQGHSYAEVLDRIARNTHSTRLVNALKELSGFVELRQRQIKKSLLLIGYPEGAQLADLEPLADVTTQRTAQEIKFLVENLDPQNSLRQAVESMLQENGYLTPAE